MPQSLLAPAVRRIELVAFDVDGTLLRGQTICERIAHGIGKSEEMSAMERLTSPAAIAAARAEMISWYRCYDRARLLRHAQSVTLARGAREGVAALKRAGIRIALVSITWDFAVDWLASELQADFFVGTHWNEDDTIEHFWPADKVTWLARRAGQLGLQPVEIAAVGDSSGDMQMLEYAGLGYFVGETQCGLPAHVKHWPAADIREIAREILELSGKV